MLPNPVFVVNVNFLQSVINNKAEQQYNPVDELLKL